LKIERINKGNWGKIRAFFDIRTEEGFVVKGFKIIEGINGLFVGFPSQKGQDEEYYDTVWAEMELKEKLNQLAINEYGGDISTAQNPTLNTMEPQKTKEPTPIENIQTPETFSEDDIPF